MVLQFYRIYPTTLTHGKCTPNKFAKQGIWQTHTKPQLEWNIFGAY